MELRQQTKFHVAEAQALPSRLRPGDVLDQKYLILRVLGQGGMGIVYEAEHLEIPDLHFAIKTILPTHIEDYSEHFMREAQSIAAIRHENVIKISDIGWTPAQVPYMVMEYLDSDLGKYTTARGGRLTAAEAVDLCVQICYALRAAHEKRIAHRDIKPGNCLLQHGEGRVRLVVSDFGLAKALHSDHSQHSVWTAAGSRGYMAPEVYTGNPRPDHRVDIYSVGATLFALLTGDTPALAHFESAESLRDPTLGGLIPPRLVPILQRALALRPSDRFDSAAALAEALTGSLRDSPAPTTAAHQPLRLQLVLLLLLAALTVTGAAWTLWTALSTSREPPTPDPIAQVDPPLDQDTAPPEKPLPQAPINELAPPSPDPPPPPAPTPEPKDTKLVKRKAQEVLNQICLDAAKKCRDLSDKKKGVLYQDKPLRETLTFKPSTRSFTDLGVLQEDQSFRKCLSRITTNSLKGISLTEERTQHKCTITM